MEETNIILETKLFNNCLIYLALILLFPQRICYIFDYIFDCWQPPRQNSYKNLLPVLSPDLTLNLLDFFPWTSKPSLPKAKMFKYSLLQKMQVFKASSLPNHPKPYNSHFTQEASKQDYSKCQTGIRAIVLHNTFSNRIFMRYFH